MVTLAWISGHWFDLLQSVGIVGGLVFSGIALRIDARVRRIQNLFVLTKQHREIWSEVIARPELARVLSPRVDLATAPFTQAEEIFVRFLILHLKNAFRAIEADFFLRPEGLETDVRSFFSLPIPRAIWMREKMIQDAGFVRFVESCLEKKPPR